jgi:hypothetical protein
VIREAPRQRHAVVVRVADPAFPAPIPDIRKLYVLSSTRNTGISPITTGIFHSPMILYGMPDHVVIDGKFEFFSIHVRLFQNTTSNFDILAATDSLIA